jgi:shikimate kinase
MHSKKNQKRIYLIGFMTSGKTTLGRILANVIGWNFYDLDKVLEEREEKTVHEIFTEKGEEYFREMERKTLTELSEEEFVVISLGGGTVTNDFVINFINEKGFVIYLSVSPENLYMRLKNKINRPLFRDLVLSDNVTKEDFLEKINALLSEREKFYKQADLEIASDSTRIGKTVDFIARKLHGVIDEKD